MHHRTAAILLAATLTLGGCAADSGPKENSGTVIGALSGALIGSAIGGGTGERVGAAMAGAAIGGLIGNRVGASMDEQDRQYAYEAEMNALDRGAPGAPVDWRNPD
ncbi:MAG: surface antigen, partial [Afipia broomeae]